MVTNALNSALHNNQKEKQQVFTIPYRHVDASIRRARF